MPKRRLDISNLRSVLAADRDATTVPPGVAQWAENVDPVADPGSVKGLPSSADEGSVQTLTETVVATDDTLYGWSGNELYAMSPPDSGSLPTTPETTGDPIEGEGDIMGEAARFPQTSGAPAWIGYVDGIDPAFGSFSSGPDTTANASLDRPTSVEVAVTDTTQTDENPVFKAGFTYHFAVSFLHDGYQEGPIVEAGRLTSTGYSDVTLDVVWTSPSGTNPRVTDLIVYVIEDPGGSDELPSSLPLRFVERLDVTDGSGWGPTSGTLETVDSDPPVTVEGNISGDDSSSQTDSTSYTPSSFDAAEVDGSLSTRVIAEGQNAEANATVTLELRVVDGGTVLDRSTETTTVSKTEYGSDSSRRSPTLRCDSFSGGNHTIEVEAKATLDTKGAASAEGKVEAEEVRSSSTSSSGQGYTLSWGGADPGSFISGQTYQDRTGIERAVAGDGIGEYQHAASAGAYRIIGGPSIDARISKETTDSAYVVRSKAYRPDMFDWATDIAQVGVDIQGIATSEQRVFVFCKTHTYVLDLQQFAVVDRLENVTAFNSRAATTTPQGLVFCDSNGVYLYQGEQGYRVLSDPIMEVTLDDPPVPQYRGMVTESSFTSLDYDADRQMLVLRYDEPNTSVEGGWGMYLPLPSSREQRPSPHWVHLTTDVVGNGGHPYAWTGDLYVADGVLHRLFDGSETGWTWITGLLAPQGLTREITFYRADLVGDLSGTDIYYREDEQMWQGPVTITGGGTSGHPEQATVNSSSSPLWRRATRLELRFEGSGGDQLRGIGLIHRPQRGAADR